MTQPVHVAFATLLLTGSLLFAGCATPWAVRPASTAVAGRATLVLTPDVRATGARRTQAVVEPLTAEDVDHIRVQLFRVTAETEEAVLDGQGPLSVRIERDQLDRPIVLTQLHPQTRYRVRAWAYQAADELPEHLISLDTAVDVEVGSDDRPTVSTLRIPLRDVPFHGRATLPGIELVPGGLVSDGVESITAPTAEWVQASLSPTWLGLDDDRMSARLGDPDGLPEAHVRITAVLPEATTIRAISLDGLDTEGHFRGDRTWATWEYAYYPYDRLLGVSTQGTFLTPDFVTPLGTFSGTVAFDLYAHDAADFLPGESYVISLYLANGAVWWDLFTLPAQPEGSPHE